MIKISRDQFNTRWASLPQNLREALFSDENSAILWHVCGAQHLSEDKIAVVAAVTGQAILGLIHPEDVPKQIKAELNLNQEIANTIYEEVDRKIFSSIRTDLQKVYSPVAGAGVAGKAEAAVPAENIVNLKPSPEATVAKTSPLTFVKPAAGGTSAPAAFETIPIPPVPVVSRVKPLVVSSVEPKEDSAKSDKEKLSRIFAVGDRAVPRESAKEEPFMLHKVTEIKPDETTPVDKRSRRGLFWFMGSGKLPEKEIKAKVQIEEDKIGKTEYKTESKVVSTPQAPVRIVHYSEFKTPVSPFGKEQEALKPEAPKPPMPPMPPVPPKLEASKGIPMLGKTQQPTPVSPLSPKVIKPETAPPPESVKKNVWPEPVVLKKDEAGQSKAPLRDINITMNMGAPGSSQAKEESKISYVSPASRAEQPATSRFEPPVVSRVEPQPAKRGDEAKDQNININISVTPPAQGIPMVGKVVESKAEPVIAIPEVPQFKPKTAMSDQPPIPANKIEDDVVDLRTFEIKKGSTNN